MNTPRQTLFGCRVMSKRCQLQGSISCLKTHHTLFVTVVNYSTCILRRMKDKTKTISLKISQNYPSTKQKKSTQNSVILMIDVLIKCKSNGKEKRLFLKFNDIGYRKLHMGLRQSSSKPYSLFFLIQQLVEDALC